MKTTSMKAALIVGLVFCFLANANAQTKKNFVYDKKASTEVVYSLDAKGLFLTPELKYEFKHNDEKEIIEKKAYRWSAELKEWIPYYILAITTNGDERILEYAQWNSREEEFNLNIQKSCYHFNALGELLAYSFYRWDNKEMDWQQNEYFFAQYYLAENK